MAIANGTCVSFCYQPKAHLGLVPHESHAGMSLPTSDLRCAAFRHLAMSKESKAHFGLPWVRPWDYRGECYMDGKRIQCLSYASQHVPIYLQPFPSNSTRTFKNSPFLYVRLSAMLKHVIAIGWTSVRPSSVRPSVCLSVCHTLVLYG